MININNPKISYSGIEFDLTCKNCLTAEHVVAVQDNEEKWRIVCTKCEQSQSDPQNSLVTTAYAWVTQNNDKKRASELFMKLMSKHAENEIARCKKEHGIYD